MVLLNRRPYSMDKGALTTLLVLEERGHTGGEVNKQPAADQQRTGLPLQTTEAEGIYHSQAWQEGLPFICVDLPQ
jgi:hypothetical protein